MNKEETYVFVAVRMKSSRLPLKALLDIHGKTLIQRLVDRLSETIPLERIVLCTSVHYQDDAIQHFASDNGINFFRGDELDVMGRFLAAAEIYGAGTIARVTGDNPLTDPFMLAEMFRQHLAVEAEYTYNDDLPVGTRAEIIDIAALKRIYEQLSDPSYSEYMTYMLKRPDKMRMFRFEAPKKLLRRPEISLTVDTFLDLELVRDIYAHFKDGLPALEIIIKWLDEVPEKKIIVGTVPSILPKDVNFSFRGDDLL